MRFLTSDNINRDERSGLNTLLILQENIANWTTGNATGQHINNISYVYV